MQDQLQAAIAALHAEAPDSDHTDWAQITALYMLLETVAPNPVVTLNRAVATVMAYGPQAGLRLLAPLADNRGLAAYHRFHAVQGHLRAMAGQEQAARRPYQTALALCQNEPEKRASSTGLSTPRASPSVWRRQGRASRSCCCTAGHSTGMPGAG